MRSLYTIGAANLANIFVLTKNLDQGVGLKEGVDRNADHGAYDEGRDDDADDLGALEPDLAAPADCLEHAPETVTEVEPQENEPDYVEEANPPGAERGVQEEIGIVLKDADAEHLGELHLGPEVAQMVAYEAEDDDAEDEHVLCGPGVCCGLAGHFVALEASAGLHVPEGKPASVCDVDEETEGEDGDHDADEGGGHEVATQLEETVSCGEKLVVRGDDTVLAGEGVDDGEEINRGVEKEEDDKESAADALDELPAD